MRIGIYLGAVCGLGIHGWRSVPFCTHRWIWVSCFIHSEKAHDHRRMASCRIAKSMPSCVRATGWLASDARLRASDACELVHVVSENIVALSVEVQTFQAQIPRSRALLLRDGLEAHLLGRAQDVRGIGPRGDEGLLRQSQSLAPRLARVIGSSSGVDSRGQTAGSRPARRAIHFADFSVGRGRASSI